MSKPGRSFSSKKRNKPSRKEKPMIIITAEGRNETEAKYFNGFKTPDCPYLIKFHKAGHLTDPTKLAESISKRWDKEDADVRTGDMAFAAADSFSEMVDGMEVEIIESIIRRLKFSDHKTAVRMLQAMFLVKGYKDTARIMDILMSCEEYDEDIYEYFMDDLFESDVFEWFLADMRIKQIRDRPRLPVHLS